jgi:uncharacterized protein YjbJ (UPF0337 family)
MEPCAQQCVYDGESNHHQKGYNAMNDEHAKGAADKAKGAVKDAVGGLTGNDKLQAEGKLDKAKGAAHNVAGNIKDAAKDLTK